MATRRTFLAGMLATGLVPRPSWADAGNPAYLSAGLAPDGTFVLCGLRGNGTIAFQRPLPARGHAAAAHPELPEAVAFARRPGTYAIVLDCVTGAQKAQLNAPQGRHFYGHGTFSADGAVLFTTENDFEVGRGVVGVWDTRRGYQRVGEMSSGGIGPHDIKRLPGGDHLVVANGGIETHPETGRTKLNIPTMRPNLSYLSLDGDLVERVELDAPHKKNSVRHLAVASDGTVAFAMQWQGDVGAHPPLIGLHRRGTQARLGIATPDETRQMAGYAGSIAISEHTGKVAVTSPRGGVVQVFDLASGQLDHHYRLVDVCGVAPTPAGFVVTNGLGQIIENPTMDRTNAHQHPLRWDNHLISI